MARPTGSTIKLAFIQRFVDRHGKERFYFRKNGTRFPLPGRPGEKEFMSAYAKAMTDTQAVDKNCKAPQGTFNRLVHDYYQSFEFKQLRQPTQIEYRRTLDRFCVGHGHRLVAQMKREHVSIIMGKMQDTPAAAQKLFKRLRTLIRFALDRGLITVDPTHKMKTYKIKEYHTWTEKEISQFEKHWEAGTKQRLAFALHLYTGQRRSDVYRMTWRDIEENSIRIIQQKTGTSLLIPIHPKLQEILDATPKQHISIICTEYGKPFTVAGYGQWMSAAIRKAGLPEECKTHGLRKAAARRLAESGCTALEIASVTGHKSLSEVERYTRDANQAMLSRAAIKKTI